MKVFFRKKTDNIETVILKHKFFDIYSEISLGDYEKIIQSGLLKRWLVFRTFSKGNESFRMKINKTFVDIELYY